MNLTLGKLDDLKSHLLNEAIRSQTTWDKALAAIGRGVTARFEGATGRRFARMGGDTYECQAGREYCVVPRYPIEAVTKVELLTSIALGWQEQTDAVEAFSPTGGMINFAGMLGTHRERLRVTYTGGYWLEAATFQSAVVEVAEGAETVAVVFPTPYGAAPTVSCQILTPAGSDIIAATPLQDTVTNEGFTARLTAAAPAGGYRLSWWGIASPIDSMSETQRGLIPLTPGAESVDVVFASAFDQVPNVTAQVLLPDASGYIILSAPVYDTLTTEGVTVRLAAHVPASGYVLSWMAMPTSPTIVQPTGSYAVPDDLHLAWLLQCEHVWRQIDRQGLSVANPEALKTNLGSLAIVPEVASILRRYARYAS